ncbi:hypothetical protein V500_03405 [Pseudogymnoascus sp. VKM F-4518 (FW-2643)]|nr:hypothetical protein V500_03405 [Pseudogymnoascus sp. VKM F-4518 (FW-2643)]
MSASTTRPQLRSQPSRTFLNSETQECCIPNWSSILCIASRIVCSAASGNSSASSRPWPTAAAIPRPCSGYTRPVRTDSRYDTPRPAAGKIQWIRDEVLHPGTRVQMSQLRSMVHGLIGEARDELFGKLVVVTDEGGVPSIDWDNTVDQPSETKVGVVSQSMLPIPARGDRVEVFDAEDRAAVAGVKMPSPEGMDLPRQPRGSSPAPNPVPVPTFQTALSLQTAWQFGSAGSQGTSKCREASLLMSSPAAVLLKSPTYPSHTPGHP